MGWSFKGQSPLDTSLAISALSHLQFKDIGLNPSRLQLNAPLPDVMGALCDRLQAKPEQLCICSSTTEANFGVYYQLLKPGDHVIVEQPYYDPLPGMATSLGCQVSFLPRRFDNAFQPQIDDLKKLIKKKTKLIVLSSPHNPSGMLVNADFMKALAKLCRQHQCYALFDEVYLYAIPEDQRPDSAYLKSPYFISTSSFDKSFGLMSVRKGWILSRNRRLIRELHFQRMAYFSDSPIMDQIGAAVLKRWHDLLKVSAEVAQRNVQLIENMIDRIDHVSWHKPPGGFVCFPYLKKHTGLSLMKKMEKQGWKVIPGTYFDPDHGKHHIRLAFGAAPAQFKKGLTVLEKILNA